MTSISALNNSSAAIVITAITAKPQAPSETSGPSIGSNRSIGSTSAAKVPSSIAALSLRGTENDAGKDVMVHGQEVNDHDGDD